MKRFFGFEYDTDILQGIAEGCCLEVEADSLAQAIQKLGIYAKDDDDEHLVSVKIRPWVDIFAVIAEEEAKNDKTFAGMQPGNITTFAVNADTWGEMADIRDATAANMKLTCPTLHYGLSNGQVAEVNVLEVLEKPNIKGQFENFVTPPWSE